MKLSHVLLLAALAPALLARAQENRDDLTPTRVSYTTRVAEDLERLHVEMRVENVRRPRVHISMPAWRPGSYSLRDYGNSVERLVVVGGEEAPLETLRVDAHTWSIDTAGHATLSVAYELPVSRGRSSRGEGERPPRTGIRLEGPSTYMYVRGATHLPVGSRYVLPEGWRVANGLLPTDDPFVRLARDYDTFIDAPTTLGIFEERHFEVAGTPFTCVFFENEQQYDFDIDAFVDIVRRICVNQGQLFGSYPFPNYVFLFHLPGGGGLEHLNSTTVGLRADRQKENPEAGASVTSHEFFHTWNVKRIRPDVLGPFDYDRENYTGNLWVSEGWTSYFGTLTLARIGVLDREEYLDHLRRTIAYELNKPRRKEHSVYWASRNAWHRYRDEEGSRVDYYRKGELLGALIDLQMRHVTGGRKSLNDVMRFLNRWFAERDSGFEEGDVERACTAISNHDFAEFWARHVTGTIDPPLAEILAYAGIAYTEDVIPCAFPFDLRGTRIFGRSSEDEEPDPEGPPRPGERIVSIDGVDFEDEHDFLRNHAPGDRVRLTLESRDETREIEVELSEATVVIPTLRWLEDASEEQLAIREAWLTSVE